MKLNRITPAKIYNRLARFCRHSGYWLHDRIEMRRCAKIDINTVKTLGIMLGPYRNLTTLTASMLFLHENCQVLNHAGKRILGNRSVDFLADLTHEKLNSFIQFAIHISGSGRRGALGGSITHSHAFGSQHDMKAVFDESGLGKIKQDIHCLLWKDSLRITNAIRYGKYAMDDFLKFDKRIKFLQPIRHPLDCAVSNIRKGHIHYFPNLSRNSSLIQAAEAIVDEIFWFMALQKQYPDRFFHYFQNQIDEDMLINLAEFLGLTPDEAWINRALTVLKIKSGYSHDIELVNGYRKLVTDKGAAFPEISHQLLAFVEG